MLRLSNLQQFVGGICLIDPELVKHSTGHAGRTFQFGTSVTCQ